MYDIIISKLYAMGESYNMKRNEIIFPLQCDDYIIIIMDPDEIEMKKRKTRIFITYCV